VTPPQTPPPVVFDAITATNPYSSWRQKIVPEEYICPSPKGRTIILSQHYFPSLMDGKYNLHTVFVVCVLFAPSDERYWHYFPPTWTKNTTEIIRVN